MVPTCYVVVRRRSLLFPWHGTHDIRRSSVQPGRGGFLLVDQAYLESVFLRHDDGVHPLRREEHAELVGSAGRREPTGCLLVVMTKLGIDWR